MAAKCSRCASGRRAPCQLSYALPIRMPCQSGGGGAGLADDRPVLLKISFTPQGIGLIMALPFLHHWSGLLPGVASVTASREILVGFHIVKPVLMTQLVHRVHLRLWNGHSLRPEMRLICQGDGTANAFGSNSHGVPAPCVKPASYRGELMGSCHQFHKIL